MPPDQLCLLLAFTTHIKNIFANDFSLNLLEPEASLYKNKWAILQLHLFLKGTKRVKNQEGKLLYAATTLWIHTFRSVHEDLLKTHVRYIWAQLENSISFMPKIEKYLTQMRSLDITGYQYFPNIN